MEFTSLAWVILRTTEESQTYDDHIYSSWPHETEAKGQAEGQKASIQTERKKEVNVANTGLTLGYDSLANVRTLIGLCLMTIASGQMPAFHLTEKLEFDESAECKNWGLSVIAERAHNLLAADGSARLVKGHSVFLQELTIEAEVEFFASSEHGMFIVIPSTLQQIPVMQQDVVDKICCSIIMPDFTCFDATMAEVVKQFTQLIHHRTQGPRLEIVTAADEAEGTVS